ncbi:PEGA domain-containing protein [candidate division KSB1 bacterium]|nr:PEGA domain-containing protein [candidate division KSB1 bacterium]
MLSQSKLIILMLLVVLTLFCSFKPNFAQNNEKPRIAVLPFADTNTQAKNEGYGEAISGMLMTDLINDNIFQVIERSEIDKMMNELAFQISGAVDANTAKQIGAILGVDILVFGTVAKFDELVETDIRLVEPSHGEAILAASESCESGAGIRDMVMNLAQKIENQYLTKEKSLVNINSTPSGATVYIDNSNAGVTPLRIGINPGQHTIKIFKTNYSDWEKVVQIDQGENNFVAELSLLPGMAPAAIDKTTDMDQGIPEIPSSDTGEKKKGGSKKLLYILGGAAVVGGGYALLKPKSDSEPDIAKSKVTINVTIP